MPFDDPINPKQGAIKASEIFLDRSLEIIKNSIGETALKTMEAMMKPISDALRYNNFLLYSDGQIIWETNLGQPRIRFNADSKANNIRLRLMMLDELAQSRTVDIVIPATTGANSLTAFNTINMNNNDLVYMELSRSVILNALSATPASTPAEIILQNGIDGGSVLSGQRLLKVNMTGNTGMPAMVADLDSILQDASQTVNIPIASRYDWTDNIATYSDIWWIPHGIRWPTGVISVIGAVVASGFDAIPNYAVRTVTELNQRLAQITTTGGTLLVTAPITINTPISIPAGVTLIGRTTKNDNTSPGLYFGSGGKLIMGARSAVKDLYIRGLAGFGQISNEHIIEIASAGVQISGNFFEFMSATSTLARTINFLAGAQDFKVERNLFSALSTSTVALYYAAASYTRAFQYANQFTGITEAIYATRNAALNMTNSYGVVPVGSVLPWIGTAAANGANGSPVSLAASYAALATMLPEGWVICDGRALPTDSPLRTGGNTFTPNLTDLYLLGSNSLAAGAQAGSNNGYGTNATTSTFNNGTINTPGSFNFSFNVPGHQHKYRHVHQWTGWAADGWRTYQNAGVSIAQAGAIQSNTGVGGNLVWAFPSRLDGNNGGGAEVLRGVVGQFSRFTAPGQKGDNSITSPNDNNTLFSGDFTDANTATPVNVTVNNASGSFNPASLNSFINNHAHTVNGIFPTYLRAIYIMRYK